MVYEYSFPNRDELTFEVVNTVSLRFAPVREGSYRSVVTEICPLEEGTADIIMTARHVATHIFLIDITLLLLRSDTEEVRTELSLNRALATSHYITQEPGRAQT